MSERKHTSAVAAIVIARLRIQRRLLLWCCAAATLVGCIQPHGIVTTSDPLAARLAAHSVWLAGPVFFCSLLGIAVALAQRGDEGLRQLEMCEQSAPLFGRERARASALVPCIMATVAAFAYWLAQYISGFAAPPVFFSVALAAVLAATLVALSATLRQKSARWFYVLLAFGSATIVYFFAVYFGAPGLAIGFLFCGGVSLIALRQYGEALARYDPIPRVTHEY